LRRIAPFLVLLATAFPLPTAPAAAAEGEGWSVPALEADTLSTARRAELEAELARIRARVEREGQDWTAGETSFLRLTREERDARLLHRPWPRPIPGERADYQPWGYERESGILDWRRESGGNFVTPVRDQGACGSSWAFAATACLESAFLQAIGGGELSDFDLAEQQVLSCMADHGLPGDCGRGWPEDVLWFAQNVGLVEEPCAPYARGGPRPCGASCGEDESPRRFLFGDYGFACHALDTEAIKDALHQYGPLATTMTVHEGFEAYRDGVYEASGEVTGWHAALIIGYDDRRECFLAKNSWGESWGMGGYFLVAYDSGCDFGDWSSYARFDSGEMGPFAAFRVEEQQARTGEPLLFEDESVPLGGEVLEWEWDFEGDGRIDATGPGPHEYVFRSAGLMSPRLRVTDADGREDVCARPGRLDVIWDGPLWTVDGENGSTGGDGSPERPFLYIQMGLNAAGDGDTVLLAPGRYTGDMNTALSAYGKSLLLLGGGAPGETVLDGEGRRRLLVLDQGEGPGFQAENLSFTGGHDPERGGAVLVDGGAPRFVRCRFEGNRSEGFGGAIDARACSLVVSGCVFEDNATAGRGGGIALTAARAGIDASLFVGNTVSSGGTGIGGGAIAANGGALRIASSILSGNEAPVGGGLLLSSCSAHLRQLNLWRNRAELRGGGLAALACELDCAGAVFWQDEAPEHAEIHAPEASTAALRHCLVQGGYPGENILDADPLFVDPEAGDFRLGEGSPCLGAGPLEGAPLLDFHGELRPLPTGSAPDLGACESPLSGGTAAPEDEAPLLRFTGVYPNPFNPSTTISFELPAPAAARLLIFLPTGRLVATILDETLAAGEHRVTWTAQDENGQALASGVFLLRLDCLYEDGRQESAIHKAMLVK